MKVQFDDGPAARDIAATGQTVKRGEPADVPDDVGKQLLEQGWVEPGTRKPARTVAATPDPVKKETE
jgi:hypothetical protein